MSPSTTSVRIKDQFKDDVIELSQQLGQDIIPIPKSTHLQLAQFLKEDRELEYNYLMDLTAVDYFKRRPRFEVVYHFLSLKNKFRARVKAVSYKHLTLPTILLV